MTNDEMKALTKKHLATFEKIMDILHDDSVPPHEGQALLLFAAGLSAGYLQTAIINNDWLAPTALGWQFGAANTGG